MGTPVALNVSKSLLEQFSPSLQYFRVRFSVATSASATRDGRQADLHTKMLLAVNNDAHKKKQAHPPPGPPRMPPAAAAFASAQICVFSLGLFDVARGDGLAPGTCTCSQAESATSAHRAAAKEAHRALYDNMAQYRVPCAIILQAGPWWTGQARSEAT